MPIRKIYKKKKKLRKRGWQRFKERFNCSVADLSDYDQNNDFCPFNTEEAEKFTINGLVVFVYL